MKEMIIRGINKIAVLPVLLVGAFFLSACIQTQETITPEQTSQGATQGPAAATQTAAPTATPEPTSSPTPSPSPSNEQATLWVSPSVDMQNRVVSVDQADQDRMAYCGADSIMTSEDGGNSWRSIPIEGISAAAEGTSFQTFGSSPNVSNTCMYLALDAAHPDSYYAVFTMAHEEYGAPPVYYMGFYTTDAGITWQLIPPPEESDYESFGGLWTNEDGRVEALFNKPLDLINDSEPAYVQVTEDGGGTWNPGRLSCPSNGPCLRWGPAASNIPGMGSPLPQGILISYDGGETWEAIQPPVELRTQPPNQLAAFSETEAQIISGSIFLSAAETPAEPLRETQDGGQTWKAVELPQLPEADTFPNYFPSLQILPDGRYLAQPDGGNVWYLLSAESDAWCRVSTGDLPIYPTGLQSAGGNLWWVDADSGLARSIPQSEIKCNGE
jgi:photosystem II stability/assembly factor-like uncharacterized protein